MSDLIEKLRSTSLFNGGNAPFIESLYETFLIDPAEVPRQWRQLFNQLQTDSKQTKDDISHQQIRKNLFNLNREQCGKLASSSTGLSANAAAKQSSVLRLINAYRVRGHQNANLDPIHLREKIQLDELSLRYHGLDDEDLHSMFNTGSLYADDRKTLSNILQLLKEVYTRSVGSEYMHITSTDEKRWVQQRLETYRVNPVLTTDDQRWILGQLTAAEGLEKFLHTQYVGQKRFSLEGGESLIPLLDELIQRAGKSGIEEIVIGMAHRGRLNVLTNIIGKPPTEIYEEFTGQRKDNPLITSGDVKYHMGFSSSVETPGGIIHVALGFNPSHLEIIGPVIAGSVRARQQRHHDHTGEKVIAVVIHGDAAFAGQGVVMENFNMSQARGFSTGGTVHIVINNQIGFTTSDPLDSRSSTYCTDVAKMVQAPIFHVNGDDPEAVIFVTRLALDYRNQFAKDVVIDLVCYRRHGHNEADEPAVTQPGMYSKIRVQQPVRARYADKLIADNVVTPEQAREMVANYRTELEHGQIVSRPVLCDLHDLPRINWHSFDSAQWDDPIDTRIDLENIDSLYQRLLTFPPGWELHPRVTKIMNDRRRMMQGEKLADWGFAENLAYASILDDGYPIRISGQDCRRGTFFHRHAMVRDQISNKSYVSLQHLSELQPNFTIIDSVLSEEGVLAFEYGYATAEPYTLTIWEAQFGDFANGAQVVIDQFVTSGGAKWGLHCGLVMLLPHGYEGQGAEHSSARLERYMQLCAEQNIQVCVPTTPAQIFHLLRRQMLRRFRRPLIVLTPKSLLRHKLATSALDTFTGGHFQTVIPEIDPIDFSQIKRVIICTGKIYYELLEARRERGQVDTAIIRLEQLYPFPRQDFEVVISKYKYTQDFIWCQEEPQNQGAWDQIKHRFSGMQNSGKEIYYIGRKSAAAPATGFSQVHKKMQKTIVNDALDGKFDKIMNKRMF